MYLELKRIQSLPSLSLLRPRSTFAMYSSHERVYIGRSAHQQATYPISTFSRLRIRLIIRALFEASCFMCWLRSRKLMSYFFLSHAPLLQVHLYYSIASFRQCTLYNSLSHDLFIRVCSVVTLFYCPLTLQISHALVKRALQ